MDLINQGFLNFQGLTFLILSVFLGIGVKLYIVIDMVCNSYLFQIFDLFMGMAVLKSTEHN